jgi:hypothetical protein
VVPARSRELKRRKGSLTLSTTIVVALASSLPARGEPLGAATVSPPSPADLGAVVPDDASTTSPAPPAVRAPQQAAPQPEEGRLTLGLSAGPSWLSFAGRGSSDSAQASGALELRYRVARRALDAEVGLRAGGLRLPYASATASGTSHVWSALIIGRLARHFGGAIEVGAHAGFGVASWTGLDPGNPFTFGGAASTGPVPMPTFAIGLDVAVAPLSWRRLFVVLTPTYVVSATTSAGLTARISHVDHLDVLAGMAARF